MWAFGSSPQLGLCLVEQFTRKTDLLDSIGKEAGVSHHSPIRGPESINKGQQQLAQRNSLGNIVFIWGADAFLKDTIDLYAILPVTSESAFNSITTGIMQAALPCKGSSHAQLSLKDTIAMFHPTTPLPSVDGGSLGTEPTLLQLPMAMWLTLLQVPNVHILIGISETRMTGSVT
ncbi:hypothetical protein E2C01_000458 [Portunus trituberculatus]|uniref:Uncharacterized protein n=1 Tax=Portunus trituberculatus TaxID=210409 RepID=A0A5B7CGH8_PORTR|nr:hypothetical protein [Portunus trituberculatus]